MLHGCYVDAVNLLRLTALKLHVTSLADTPYYSDCKQLRQVVR